MLTTLVMLLPPSSIKNRMLRLLGHDVDRGALIGPNLFRSVGAISIAAGARIGFFNVFRDLTLLAMAPGASIGQFNWITAAPVLVRSGGSGELRLGRAAAVTSRHYIDVSGGVTFGEFTTVAGARSSFFTHGIDVAAGAQTTAPIEVGAYSLVCSNVSVTPGTTVPARSVVAMGSVVNGDLSDVEGYLIAGVPAVPKHPVTGAYFTRSVAYVSPGPTGAVRD